MDEQKIPPPSQSSVSVSLGINAIKDSVAGLIAVAMSVSAYMKRDDTWPQSVAVCLILFGVYLLYRMNEERVKNLRVLVDKQEDHTAACEEKMVELQRFIQKIVLKSNAGTMAMWKDLMILAGDRHIGNVEIDSETGVMVYVPVQPPAPPLGLGDRRGGRMSSEMQATAAATAGTPTTIMADNVVVMPPPSSPTG